jgi:hypothetical protein
MSATQYYELLERVRSDIAAPLGDTEEHITASVPSAAPTVFASPAEKAAPATPAATSPTTSRPPSPPEEFSDSY